MSLTKCRMVFASGLIALLAVASGGCAANRLTEEAHRAPDGSYDEVYTVGSHIPKKVRKGDEASSNDGASPVAVAEGERARELIRMMQRRN